jgi:hypothetical protein
VLYFPVATHEHSASILDNTVYKMKFEVKHERQTAAEDRKARVPHVGVYILGPPRVDKLTKGDANTGEGRARELPLPARSSPAHAI